MTKHKLGRGSRPTAQPKEEAGYLILMGWPDDKDFVGIFWAPRGWVDQALTDIKRIYDCPEAVLRDYRKATKSEWERIGISCSGQRRLGRWYKRDGAVKALLDRFEEEDRLADEEEMRDDAERAAAEAKANKRTEETHGEELAA